MSPAVRALCVAILLGLAGCSARMTVTDITRLPPGSAVDGVPFRERETHTVRVFQYVVTKPRLVDPITQKVLQQEEHEYREVFVTDCALANDERLYAVNFRAEAFADHEFTLQYLPDNTISRVRVTGTPNAAGFAAGTSQGLAVAQGVATFDEQVRAKERALAALAKTDRETTADRYASRAAVDDAEAALALVRGKRPTNDAVAFEVWRRQVQALMEKVNAACLKSGEPIRYPDPVIEAQREWP